MHLWEHKAEIFFFYHWSFLRWKPGYHGNIKIVKQKDLTSLNLVFLSFLDKNAVLGFLSFSILIINAIRSMNKMFHFCMFYFRLLYALKIMK